MFSLFFFLVTIYCSALPVISGDDQTAEVLKTLVSKVDKIYNNMEEMKILNRDFGEKTRDKLAEISGRVDEMQLRMTAVETTLKGYKLSGLENKIDQFGKKVVDQQSAARNDARDVLAITRSFKGFLEEGIKKMVNTLNSKNKKNDDEDEENEVFILIDNVKKAVDKCTASSSNTRQRLDDVFTLLLQEWTTAHKKMREIDIKLSQPSNPLMCDKQTPEVDRKISNSTGADIHSEEIRLVANRIRQDYKSLEQLEPRLLHAIRVSAEIENVRQGIEPIGSLSGNLSVTLKGLQDFLEKNLKSIGEGIEIIDEFLINPVDAQKRSTIFLSYKNAEDTLGRLEKGLNDRLAVMGEEIRGFLSKEGLASLNALKEELRRSAALLEKKNESQLKWMNTVQEGITKVQDVISNAAEEVKKCTGTSPNAMKQDIARMLRNSLGRR